MDPFLPSIVALNGRIPRRSARPSLSARWGSGPPPFTMRRACSRVVVGASLRKAWQLSRPWPARAPFSPQAPQPRAQSAQARARGPARRRSQICSPQDALVARDEGGNVYQYNFKRNTWAKLAADGDRGQENLDARVRTLARYQRRSAVWDF